MLRWVIDWVLSVIRAILHGERDRGAQEERQRAEDRAQFEKEKRDAVQEAISGNDPESNRQWLRDRVRGPDDPSTS